MSYELREVRTAGVSALVALALFFSGLFTMLTPLPMLYASLTKGKAAGYASAALAVVVAAVVYIFFLPQAEVAKESLGYLLIPGQGFAGYLPGGLIRFGGLGYFGFYAVVALMLSEGVRRRWGLLRWGGTALAAGLIVLAVIALSSLGFGASEVVEGIRSYTAFVFGEVARGSEAAGEAGARMAFLAENANEISGYFLWVMPSLLFVFAVLAVAINVVVSRRVVKGHQAFSHVHNVARFRMPDWLIWGVIVSGVVFFVDAYVVKLGWPKLMALNGLIGFGVFYFLQGLAVIVYFVQGIRSSLMRMLAYVAMVLFLQAVSLGLLAVGVADVWVNFRLRRWRALHHHS